MFTSLKALFPWVVLLVLSLGADSCPQADWPQLGGPRRNFKVESNGLANSWPESGLRRLWMRPLGDGYSGIAVVKGRLYTMYRKDDHESVVALDAATGQTSWEHRYPAPFLPNSDLEPGPGPHATPLVVDGHVVAVGVTGILHCLDSSSGRMVWSHNLITEFDGTVLYRGYSSSPIAYQDSVNVPVGGMGHASGTTISCVYTIAMSSESAIMSTAQAATSGHRSSRRWTSRPARLPGRIEVYCGRAAFMSMANSSCWKRTDIWRWPRCRRKD